MAGGLDQINDTWLLYALAFVTILFPILYVCLNRVRSILGIAVVMLAGSTAALVIRRVVVMVVPMPHIIGSMITTATFLTVITAYVVKIAMVLILHHQALRDMDERNV